jgi:hypothetical protein
MRVVDLEIENFRSFVNSGQLRLGRMSVFIGPNNAGKSSVLKALYLMQGGADLADVRVGAQASSIRINLEDIGESDFWNRKKGKSWGRLAISLNANGNHQLHLGTEPNNNGPRVESMPMREPDHFIVPYFSRRKTASYMTEVNTANAVAIDADFSRLTAKLSRLGNPSFPGYKKYAQTSEEILGFIVSAIPAEHGQVPGIYLPDGRTLPMAQMGEGVPNIVGLLADLAQSNGKLFLIEEPENDLHPEALKALLELILESSQTNQVVVSTHSNIVARYLASTEDSKLYYVTSETGDLPPVAQVEEVESTPAARLKVLRELGYSFSDFDLWDGWLILEESSAERIIRDYLIPWFAPKLTRVRTISAGGNSQVEPTFQDFFRLVRFTHLEDAYRDAAWVLVDGDEDGRGIVADLRSKFPDWSENRFDCFDAPNFETYYPAEFSDKVSSALRLRGREKRESKRVLLEEVRAWLDEDETRGRTALGASASSVIERLQQIEVQLFI